MTLDRTRIYIVFLFFWIVPYSVTSFVGKFTGAYLLPMWIDNYIPLWSPALLGYALYFPLVFFTFILVKDLNISKKGIHAFIISAVITSSFFLAVPTKMPRPPLVSDGFFDTALNNVWILDTAKNAFPSQHVAFSFVCAFVLATAYRKWGWFFILVALVIAVSTLLVKQHYVWDVVGGFVVAVFAYWWAFVRAEKVAVASKALE